MSMTTVVILAGAAGGATWAGITLAATWWFNRRVRGLSSENIEAIRSRILGRQS